jgi:hypothetical protein
MTLPLQVPHTTSRVSIGLRYKSRSPRWGGRMKAITASTQPRSTGGNRLGAITGMSTVAFAQSFNYQHGTRSEFDQPVGGFAEYPVVERRMTLEPGYE